MKYGKYGFIYKGKCPFCDTGLTKTKTDGFQEEEVSADDVKFCFHCGAALERAEWDMSEKITIDDDGEIYVGDTDMLSANIYDGAGFCFWEGQWRKQGKLERAKKFEENYLNIKALVERRNRDGRHR